MGTVNSYSSWGAGGKTYRLSVKPSFQENPRFKREIVSLCDD
jgi:hypothetical protein